MKKLIQNYNFDASNKTITLNESDSVGIEQLLLITNVTDGVIIYNFADSLKNATISSNVITLEYDTTGMDDSDKLQIFIDVQNTDFDDLTDILKYGLVEIVRQLQSMRNDGGLPDVSGRMRCAVETLPTLSTVTTVGTITNQVNQGGFALAQQYMSMVNQGAGNIRNRITVS